MFPGPPLMTKLHSWPPVLGGSSSINAMIYMRGQAADYDGWRQLGLTGWGWDDVRPVYERFERRVDADGRAAFRGGSPAIGAWLRFRREPFAWALEPARLAAFLRPLGFDLLAVVGAPELRAEVLAPAGLATIPLAEGEHLCLAAPAP
jgi:hypothetical protein